MQDFYDLTWAYLERAAANKVVYVEIMFDPQTHTERGVPMQTVISGITRALKEAGPELGIQGNLMMNFLRHLGPEAALVTLKEVRELSLLAQGRKPCFKPLLVVRRGARLAG